MTSMLGVPVKLLHEALGHVVTVEPKMGRLSLRKTSRRILETTVFDLPWLRMF
jgi:hypothetical protein